MALCSTLGAVIPRPPHLETGNLPHHLSCATWRGRKAYSAPVLLTPSFLGKQPLDLRDSASLTGGQVILSFSTVPKTMCHGPEASKAPAEAVEAAAEFQARAPPLTRQPLPNTHSNTRLQRRRQRTQSLSPLLPQGISMEPTRRGAVKIKYMFVCRKLRTVWARSNR